MGWTIVPRLTTSRCSLVSASLAGIVGALLITFHTLSEPGPCSARGWFDLPRSGEFVVPGSADNPYGLVACDNFNGPMLNLLTLGIPAALFFVQGVLAAIANARARVAAAALTAAGTVVIALVLDILFVDEPIQMRANFAIEILPAVAFATVGALIVRRQRANAV